MATITQILETEATNFRSIHLFREGLFYRAYQHSAFQFINNVKSFKAVKKYYKAVGGDVVVLGFPTSMLGDLFPDQRRLDVVEEGMHLVVQCEPIDEKAYTMWFESVQPAPEKPKKVFHKQAERFDFVPASDHVTRMTPNGVADGNTATTVASGGTLERVVVQSWQGSEVATEFPAPHAEVIRQLQNFSIESATPLDCMLFLSKLKSKLRG